MSLRDQILRADFAIRRVEVPELPVASEPYVRMMPANRRQEMVDLGEQKDGLERLAIMATVDAHGDPVFTDDDLEAVGQLPLAVLNRIVEAFFDHNGWSEAGRAEMGKDSTTIPGSPTRTLSAVN